MQKLVGKINEIDIYTDDTLVECKGIEYKRVRRWKWISFVFKTVREPIMEPVKSVVLVEENKLLVHPKYLKMFKTYGMPREVHDDKRLQGEIKWIK